MSIFLHDSCQINFWKLWFSPSRLHAPARHCIISGNRQIHVPWRRRQLYEKTVSRKGQHNYSHYQHSLHPFLCGLPRFIRRLLSREKRYGIPYPLRADFRRLYLTWPFADRLLYPAAAGFLRQLCHLHAAFRADTALFLLRNPVCCPEKGKFIIYGYDDRKLAVFENNMPAFYEALCLLDEKYVKIIPARSAYGEREDIPYASSPDAASGMSARPAARKISV